MKNEVVNLKRPHGHIIFWFLDLSDSILESSGRYSTIERKKERDRERQERYIVRDRETMI